MLNDIDLARIDLNLLVVFDAVMQERNVARAATRLFVTPSAVSHGLGRLRTLLHDPLFTKSPRGVVPSARAVELAAPIGEVLARVREVVGSAEPFEPTRSKRRFALGGPDSVTAMLLARLLPAVRAKAPGVVVTVRDMLPMTALAALDAHDVDIALAPVEAVPARFVHRRLYDEEFAIGARRGHPFALRRTLERYCAAQHVLVSTTGDPRGYVDHVLAEHGAARQVVLTVPTFMLALAVVADTDLLAAVPRSLLLANADRFGVVAVDPPVALPSTPILAIAPAAVLRDPGVAWLFELIERTVRIEPARRRGTRR